MKNSKSREEQQASSKNLETKAALPVNIMDKDVR